MKEPNGAIFRTLFSVLTLKLKQFCRHFKNTTIITFTLAESNMSRATAFSIRIHYRLAKTQVSLQNHADRLESSQALSG